MGVQSSSKEVRLDVQGRFAKLLPFDPSVWCLPLRGSPFDPFVCSRLPPTWTRPSPRKVYPSTPGSNPLTLTMVDMPGKQPGTPKGC